MRNNAAAHATLVHCINYSAIILPCLQYKCCNHPVSVFGPAKDRESEEEKGGRERGSERSTCFCFVQCWPRANIVLVNRNILVRQEHPWLVFTFPAARPEACSSAEQLGSEVLRLEVPLIKSSSFCNIMYKVLKGFTGTATSTVPQCRPNWGGRWGQIPNLVGSQ